MPGLDPGIIPLRLNKLMGQWNELPGQARQ
jgi:hypothetical protein